MNTIRYCKDEPDPQGEVYQQTSPLVRFRGGCIVRYVRPINMPDDLKNLHRPIYFDVEREIDYDFDGIGNSDPCDCLDSAAYKSSLSSDSTSASKPSKETSTTEYPNRCCLKYIVRLDDFKVYELSRLPV